MPQPFLHPAHVFAVAQHVRGPRVAQRMRRDIAFNAGDPGILARHQPDSLARQPRALWVQEYIVCRSIAHQFNTRATQVVSQGLNGARQQRRFALAVPASHAAQFVGLQVDIFQAQVDRFGDAHAGGIDHLQQGAVTR